MTPTRRRNSSHYAPIRTHSPPTPTSPSPPPLMTKYDLEMNDDRPPVTTKRELWGWYGYGIASEPFSVVTLAVFVPIILETLAVQAGKKANDPTRTIPCDPKVDSENGCLVNWGGWWIFTSSFPLYVISISVAIQALVFISMGALADHGTMRKTFLLFFAALGGISSILLLVVTSPDMVWLAAMLVIMANVAFGTSYVFFYAYIPTLTLNHPEVRAAEETGSEEAIHKTVERVGNGISTHGMAAGYAAGVFLLIVCGIIVFLMGQDKVYPMIIGCAITGVWWLVFSIMPWRMLQNRAGPPLPRGENFLFYSWKQLFKTVRSIRRLSQAFRFLLAWFLLSDGISTVCSVSIIFGKGTLHMPQLQLIIAAIVVPIAALGGTYFWLWIQRRFHLSTRVMLMILCSLYALLPLYGLLGFFAPFGLKTIPEVWLVCVWYGLMLGAVQSFSRVLFAELLPPGKENEFFSLYEITDKGSAWIGPFASAAIADATHELRYSFYFLLVMLVVPVFLIWSVDVKKGKEDAKRFALQEKEAASS